MSEERYASRPSVKPNLVMATVVALVGGTLSILSYTEMLGMGSGFGKPLGMILGIATVLLLGKTTLKIYILMRTRYQVTEDAVRMRCDLLYKNRNRHLPLAKLRGYEVRQNRFQSLFSLGTISFLSGGTNQSLGFVKFENISDFEAVTDTIEKKVDSPPVLNKEKVSEKAAHNDV